MEQFEKKISQFEQALVALTGKMDKVIDALMGNDIGRDGGIVKRIEELELQNTEILKSQEENYEKIRSEIEEIREEQMKTEVHQKIIWALGSALITGVFFKILDIIFKKF